MEKICKTRNVDFVDIVEYVPDAEIWDLYNENRELLGKDHVRGEQLPIDGYHLVVYVWIRNSKGEYLISQRSANRPIYPLLWECVGGSVIKGEDSLFGAIREAKEEVGVDLLPENGRVLFSKTRKIIDGKVYHDIMDVWLFEYDGEVEFIRRYTMLGRMKCHNHAQKHDVFYMHQGNCHNRCISARCLYDNLQWQNENMRMNKANGKNGIKILQRKSAEPLIKQLTNFVKSLTIRGAQLTSELKQMKVKYKKAVDEKDRY